MTERSRVWLDTETTGLHRQRRAWEIAAIVRPHDGSLVDDIEFSCFVDIADLDLAGAEPDALAIGRFWQRHPQAHLVPLVGTLLGVERKLPDVLPVGAVRREWEALATLAELTKGAVVHGSNPAFDVETLAPRMAYSRLEPGWHYHPEDVPSVARGWLLGRGHRDVPRKSDKVSALCGIDPAKYDRHTALGDCRWTRDLSDAIERDGHPDMYESAYFGIQKVLDRVIGDEGDAGVGAGIVADVALLAQWYADLRQRTIAGGWPAVVEEVEAEPLREAS